MGQVSIPAITFTGSRASSVGGKGKGEAEQEAPPVDVRSLMP